LGSLVGALLPLLETTQRPDLVHVATEGPLGLAALWAARQLELPVTSSFHTNFHHYSGHYGAKALQRGLLSFLRWFHNASKLTLVPTAQMSAELAEAGFERLGVMSRGVDTQLFDPARRSSELRATWGAGPATPVLAYVGRLAAEKNLGLAVEAFRDVQRAVPDAKFVLVGDGPERGPLARQSPEFHYAGMRRGEDLATHYASADLFLFPSTTETFGNVVTEALASGLVVLAYDYAATREHVRDGVNGFAVPFDEAAAFRRAAVAALRRRSEWAGLRAAARETALGLTWATIVERFERQISEAAGLDVHRVCAG
jgi:glycosyltransferase involved in cell wall biosynthesis